MPDKVGKLSQKEIAKIANWLNEKGKNHLCPVCHTNQWHVGEHLLNALVYHPGGALVLRGPTYPSVFIVCQNCYYTRQFMAVPILGPEALKSEQTETPEESNTTKDREVASG